MRDVFACYLTDGASVSHSFHRSLVALMVHDEMNGKRLLAAGPRCRRTGPGDLANGRNALTRMWLDETEAEWLWMVDSDMGFLPETLDALLAVGTTWQKDGMGAVGALCFSWRADEPDGMGGFRAKATPTIFFWKDEGFQLALDYPRNTVIPVDGTGAACLLVHRSVAEKVREICGDDWWTPVRYPHGEREFLGEDLSFCYRVRSVNRAIFVDTRIKTTHAKMAWIGEEQFNVSD